MAKKPTYETLEQRVKELEKMAGNYKLAEKGPRKNEEKFKFLAENIADIVWTLDLNLNTTYVNPSIEKLLGFTQEERMQQSLEDMMVPESLQKAQTKLLEELLHEKVDAYDSDRAITIEVEYYHKDGSIVLMENMVKGMRDSSGALVGILGVSRDITERKRAEDRLRESEMKFRGLFDLSPQGIAVTDVETGRLIDVNDMFCKVTKYDKEDVLGKTTTELEFYSKEDRDRFLKNLQSSGELHGLEMDFKAKDGSIINTEMFARVFPLQGKNNLITSFYDRTEWKRLQSQLVQAQKMESLGLLAGGVAHDLNNVLSGIVSYPELLLMDLPEDSKFRKPIQTIQDSGNRAAAIVQDLLTVARGVAISKEPLSLNNLINDYLKSPEFKKLKQFHPMVNVNTELNMELFNIRASYVHIRKAVMNLVSNASEAVRRGGNVTIATRNCCVDKSLRGYDDVNIGEYTLLSVTDDGPGISADDFERIFEPFYTKKVMGRSGTGLGLAVVWNVVQDHEGYINVTTDKAGTTFELYFPITRDKVSVKDLTIKMIDYKGKGEKILVVDDVESQRKIACSMLEALGYDPEAVASGEEAVEYVKDNMVDLILLDMIMARVSMAVRPMKES